MDKRLYKGIFNWYNELIILYTHAWSERGAKSQFVSQLAKKVNRIPDSIRRYYSDGKANYEIKAVIEQ